MNPSKPRIALVDDDGMCSALALAVLKRVGYDAIAFTSASDFLTSLNTAEYQLVILDLNMPEMSGDEIQLKLNDRASVPPILFVSAEADPVSAAAVLQVGAFDILSKPIDPQTLLEKVSEALNIGLNKVA